MVWLNWEADGVGVAKTEIELHYDIARSWLRPIGTIWGGRFCQAHEHPLD